MSSVLAFTYFFKVMRLTGCRPADYAQLTRNIDDIASNARSTIVSRKRLLCKHLLDGRPGREPTSAVVDGVDVVEFFGSCLVRALVVAQHACLMLVKLHCLGTQNTHQHH